MYGLLQRRMHEGIVDEIFDESIETIARNYSIEYYSGPNCGTNPVKETKRIINDLEKNGYYWSHHSSIGREYFIFDFNKFDLVLEALHSEKEYTYYKLFENRIIELKRSQTIKSLLD